MIAPLTAQPFTDQNDEQSAMISRNIGSEYDAPQRFVRRSRANRKWITSGMLVARNSTVRVGGRESSVILHRDETAALEK
jgi:hypothetical protein